MIPETYWRKSSTIVGPAEAKDFGSIGQQDTREAFERFIVSRSNGATTLLDAGCNTGVEGHRLFQARFPGCYIGVDSNPLALSYALQNLSGHPATFTLADLTDIPFRDRYFDIVLTKDVIEHAAGFEPILGELTRLTKRYLLLSMFIKATSEPDIIHLHRDGYYLNRYQAPRLFEFVTSCGFSKPESIFENNTDQVLVFERTE